MNTTTSPQVGKGTLRDAGIMEQEEPDVDNARYGQSISMKTGGTGNYNMSQVMRKPVNIICKQQRHRSACASMQSSQHHCCSLPRWYNRYT